MNDWIFDYEEKENLIHSTERIVPRDPSVPLDCPRPSLLFLFKRF